jgi:type IV pilus biogenesis protein CpaD/CtpE
MGLAYRGEYANPMMVELELERLDARLSRPMMRLTTTERDRLESVAEGTLIYNLTTHKLNVFTGSSWEAVTSA